MFLLPDGLKIAHKKKIIVSGNIIIFAIIFLSNQSLLSAVRSLLIKASTVTLYFCISSHPLYNLFCDE